MKLVTSEQIACIDAYAEHTLGISRRTLMERAGRAVAHVAEEQLPQGAEIVILAGAGNNGGDGYAAASMLCDTHRIRIIDVFSKGQRTEEGRYFLSLCQERCIPILPLCEADLSHADLIVDAVFGTGRRGELPALLLPLVEQLQESRARKLAVDIPLGVDADTGEVSSYAYHADVTVVLTCPKVGTLSYPAREYLGDVHVTTLGLELSRIPMIEDSPYVALERSDIQDLLPPRPTTAHKGTFGKLLMLTGSEQYRGAAHLSLGAALRSGVGLVSFLGTDSLCRELRMTYPEALYRTETDLPSILAAVEDASAVAVGCGIGTDSPYAQTILALLKRDGAPLLLDADAINILSTLGERGRDALRTATRRVILTPHPLELSRLVGSSVGRINASRLAVATQVARDLGVVLVLKGAGTVVTDGTRTYINTTGGTALSKGGSGDVLAGLIGGLLAEGADPLLAAAVGVFLHGMAADRLCAELSPYGVTASDLPLEIARLLGQIARHHLPGVRTIE